jgi:hypothetical protein
MTAGTGDQVIRGGGVATAKQHAGQPSEARRPPQEQSVHDHGPQRVRHPCRSLSSMSLNGAVVAPRALYTHRRKMCSLA